MKTTLIGAPAPPLELATPTGRIRSLREFLGSPVIVSFLGPANCLFCRAHVIRLIQAHETIAGLGAEVIFVAYNDPELMMTKMFHSLELPYVLLADRERAAYAQWGLGPANLRSVLNPGLYWATLVAALRVLLGRERSLGKAPEENQLGGDFVVDRAGNLAFVNRMKSFHDRAALADLVAALERS